MRNRKTSKTSKKERENKNSTRNLLVENPLNQVKTMGAHKHQTNHYKRDIQRNEHTQAPTWVHTPCWLPITTKALLVSFSLSLSQGLCEVSMTTPGRDMEKNEHFALDEQDDYITQLTQP